MSVSPVDFISRSDKALYVLSPFLDFDSLVESSRGKYKKDDLESRLNSALERFEDNRFTGSLKRYLFYHFNLKESLPDLMQKYKYKIFVTSVSSDLSFGGIPRRIGCDPQQTLFNQSTLILQKAVENPEFYEDALFIYLGPVIWPVVFKDGKCSHADPDSVVKADCLTLKHSRSKPNLFGPLEKTLEQDNLNEGNYHFAEHVFDLNRKISHVMRTPDLKTRLMDMFGYDHKKAFTHLGYEVFLAKLGLQKTEEFILSLCNDAFIFSGKGSYAYQTSVKAAEAMEKNLFLIGGPSGPLASKKVAVYGESEPFAISALNGALKSLYDNGKGMISAVKFSFGRALVPDLDFKSCAYHNCIKCSSQTVCDSIQIPCASHKFKSLGKQRYSEVEEDCLQENYGVFEGVEAVIYLLNSGRDFWLWDSSFRKRGSWLKERGNARIEPFVLPDVKEQPALLRASGLELDCALKAFIGSYKNYLDVEIEDNRLARIGDAAHEFFNTDYVNELKDVEFFLPNKLLEKMDMELRLRSEYCEKYLYYEHNGIVVPGHPDSVFKFGNSIIVFDLKRFPKFGAPKYGHRYQLLNYGLGLQQRLDNEFENIYCMTLNRPFVDPKLDIPKVASTVSFYRDQPLTIWKVSKGDFIIQDLHNRIEHNYSLMQDLLTKGMKKPDNCERCFEDTKQYCAFVFEKAEEFGGFTPYLNNLVKLKEKSRVF